MYCIVLYYIMGSLLRSVQSKVLATSSIALAVGDNFIHYFVEVMTYPNCHNFECKLDQIGMP